MSAEPSVSVIGGEIVLEEAQILDPMTARLSSECEKDLQYPFLLFILEEDKLISDPLKSCLALQDQSTDHETNQLNSANPGCRARHRKRMGQIQKEYHRMARRQVGIQSPAEAEPRRLD